MPSGGAMRAKLAVGIRRGPGLLLRGVVHLVIAAGIGFGRADRRVRRRHGPSAAAAPSAELTSQELRVARLVAKGQSNREVADILYLSTKTVEAHLRQVFRKLGVRSRGELAARAARIGLDEP